MVSIKSDNGTKNSAQFAESYIRNSVWLFGSLIVIISVVTSFCPVDNFDIWWHLKTGEYIISENSIPGADLFSFTAEGNLWITHEWLAEVIFQFLYIAGGLNLLILFKVFVSALIAFILVYATYKSGIKNPLIYILLSAAVCIGSFRLFIRPHLFTYLFLAILTVNIFARGYFEGGKIRIFVFAPLLFMVWANLHSGFIIGLGVYWLISIGTMVGEGLRESMHDSTGTQAIKRYLLPPFAATIAAMINPNGLKAFAYPFLLASEPVFKKAIAELVSPFEILATEKLYWFMLVVILCFSLYLLIRNIKRRPVLSVILVIGIISGLTSIRNAYEFALLASGISIVTFGKSRPRYSGMILLPALLFVIFSGYLTAGYMRDTRGMGFGISTDLPRGTAEYLDEIEYHGNIYAPLGWGSYFIWSGWPDRKVFIDGRLLVYGADILNEYHYIRQNEPGALEYLSELNVDAVAVPLSGNRWRIREAVDLSPDWQLCYFDDRSVLFLRVNEHNERWLDDYGFKKINPLRSGYISRRAQIADTLLILKEALRAYEQSPGSVTTNAVLARAYFLNSDYSTAAEYYKAAYKIIPKMSDFLYQVAVSYHRGGEFDSAAVWYEKSIEARPQNEQAYFEYGAMEAGRGHYQKAIDILNQAVRLEPDSRAVELIEAIKTKISYAKRDSS